MRFLAIILLTLLPISQASALGCPKVLKRFWYATPAQDFLSQVNQLEPGDALWIPLGPKSFLIALPSKDSKPRLGIYRPHRDRGKRDENGGMEVWRIENWQPSFWKTYFSSSSSLISARQLKLGLDSGTYKALEAAWESKETLNFTGGKDGPFAEIRQIFSVGQRVDFRTRAGLASRAIPLSAFTASAIVSLFTTWPIGIKTQDLETKISIFEGVTLLPTLVDWTLQKRDLDMDAGSDLWGPLTIIHPSLRSVNESNDGRNGAVSELRPTLYLYNPESLNYWSLEGPERIESAPISRWEYVRSLSANVDRFGELLNRYKEIVSDSEKLREIFTNPLMAENLTDYSFYREFYGSIPGVDPDLEGGSYSNQDYWKTTSVNAITMAAAHNLKDGRFLQGWHKLSDTSSVGGPAQKFIRPRVLPIDVLYPLYRDSDRELFAKAYLLQGSSSKLPGAKVGISADNVLSILFSPKVMAHAEWPSWVESMRNFGHAKEIDFLLNRDPKLLQRYQDWKQKKGR